VAGALALSSATYSVGESGPTVTITVNRSGGLASGVGISYATSNGTATAGSDYTSTSGTLTFNGGVTSQTFTVPILQDSLVEGNETFNVALSSATGGGTLGSPSSAVVTIVDDDVAGITVTPTSGLLTTEAGGKATFTVKLNSQPTATVTIGLSSSDTTEGTVSPASLTFTQSNWSTPQTVTVTGVDDQIVDGNIAYTIVTAAAVSTDANYNGRNAADVSVVNIDNDAPLQNTVFLASDPLDSTKQALFVYGTAANDVILVNPGRAAGSVAVQFNGQSRGTFSPTGRIIVHGLAGNDTIGVSSQVTRPAWLYGEDGSDVLWGGGGPNLLFGGAGNDTLYSGKGRNLLIGGAGSDLLTGGAGDALFIGGTTAYDANDLALAAIMNEWNSNAGCATRVGHLTGTTGGLNGSCYLRAATVFNDNASDKLRGGCAADVFFQGLGDTISNRQRNDWLFPC
jgi:Ca2+-binding RTX toxin-like protein